MQKICRQAEEMFSELEGLPLSMARKLDPCELYELLFGNSYVNYEEAPNGTKEKRVHFECCTFDHSDNSPCLFSSGFLSGNLLKNSLERKQERRQKIFDFEIFCVEEYQGESGGRNSQLLPKFRVLHPWAM